MKETKKAGKKAGKKGGKKEERKKKERGRKKGEEKKSSYRVVGRDVANPDERRFGFGQFARSEVGAGQVLQHFHVGILEKLFQTVFVHLDGGDHLFLFDVNVGDVEPDVAKVRRGLAHLSEDVPGLGDVSLLGQNGADPVGRPNVALVELEHLFVRVEGAVLMPLLLVLVLARLVQRLQPDVAQGDQRIRVLLRRGMLENPLELFLSRTPLLLRQMEIADERPGVRIVLVDLQRLFEPIRGFVDLTAITRHAAQTQVAVDVVAVLTQDALNVEGEYQQKPSIESMVRRGQKSTG